MFERQSDGWIGSTAVRNGEALQWLTGNDLDDCLQDRCHLTKRAAKDSDLNLRSFSPAVGACTRGTGTLPNLRSGGISRSVPARVQTRSTRSLPNRSESVH